MEFRNLNQDVSPSDETNYCHMMNKQDKCRQYTLSDITRMEISHKNINICCQTPLNNYQMAGNTDFGTSELSIVTRLLHNVLSQNATNI